MQSTSYLISSLFSSPRYQFDKIYLATWFVIIDIILLGQFIYYSLINPGPAVLHISTTLEDENCPLLIEGNDSNKSEIMKKYEWVSL